MTGDDQLDAQVLARVADELASQRPSALGDSPIERLLYRAIQSLTLVPGCACEQVIVAADSAMLFGLMRGKRPYDLVMALQVEAAGWRTDFLICAWDHNRQAWRQLIVECDGHDFHERTKEQAARDRSRDRKAQMLGFPILRFTGSEIVKDPLGCAMQVAAWAEQGW